MIDYMFACFIRWSVSSTQLCSASFFFLCFSLIHFNFFSSLFVKVSFVLWWKKRNKRINIHIDHERSFSMKRNERFTVSTSMMTDWQNDHDDLSRIVDEHNADGSVTLNQDSILRSHHSSIDSTKRKETQEIWSIEKKKKKQMQTKSTRRKLLLHYSRHVSIDRRFHHHRVFLHKLWLMFVLDN